MPCYAEAIHVRANALPLHCPALLVIALAPFFFSMPLLYYARLDLSVQCLSDTILVIATTKRYLSTPLLSLSSQCLRFSHQCHRRSLPFNALASLIPASPLQISTALYKAMP